MEDSNNSEDEKNLDRHTYVSNEVDISGINISSYSLPKNKCGEIYCNLDARKWTNRSGGKSTILTLFVTTDQNIKLKFHVFKNDGIYAPKNKLYSSFCCKNDLKLNDRLRILYSNSSKSDNVYIREVDIL